ncbi:MAG TPA: TCR/Tet family MFS transporter [Candidatus Eremiobacteraceae bacterium]|jgi:DHA1 family tetracycline resistance protein-like MFS transporter
MQIDTPAPRRGAVIFIFITVMLDMLSVGMVAPVLPKLVAGFLGGDAANTAVMFGLIVTVWSVMQFFASPVLGVLSDRFGRRPVIVLSNLGLGLDYVVMALAPNIGWLFAGRAISGVTAASLTAAGAYIADVTPLDKRAAGFGMISAAFGVGFVLGPAVGGLLGGFNPHFPFWVAAAFSLANALYGTFVLPESLPPEKRATTIQWGRANPLGSLRLLRSHPELSSLSVVAFLSALGSQSLQTVWVLFTIFQYNWDPRAIGFSLAMVGISTAVVQGGLVRPFVARFGERSALLVGLVCGVISLTMFALAATPLLFWAGIAVMAVWGFSPTATQSFMSKRVSPLEQGELQGAVSSIRSLTALIGPGLFTFTFAYFIGGQGTWHFAGAAWLLGALIVAAALPLAVLATRSRSEEVHGALEQVAS